MIFQQSIVKKDWQKVGKIFAEAKRPAIVKHSWTRIEPNLIFGRFKLRQNKRLSI